MNKIKGGLLLEKDLLKNAKNILKTLTISIYYLLSVL